MHKQELKNHINPHKKGKISNTEFGKKKHHLLDFLRINGITNNLEIINILKNYLCYINKIHTFSGPITLNVLIGNITDINHFKSYINYNK